MFFLSEFIREWKHPNARLTSSVWWTVQLWTFQTFFTMTSKKIASDFQLMMSFQLKSISNYFFLFQVYWRLHWSRTTLHFCNRKKSRSSTSCDWIFTASEEMGDALDQPRHWREAIPLWRIRRWTCCMHSCAGSWFFAEKNVRRSSFEIIDFSRILLSA